MVVFVESEKYRHRINKRMIKLKLSLYIYIFIYSREVTMKVIILWELYASVPFSSLVKNYDLLWRIRPIKNGKTESITYFVFLQERFNYPGFFFVMIFLLRNVTPYLLNPYISIVTTSEKVKPEKWIPSLFELICLQRGMRNFFIFVPIMLTDLQQ